MTAPLLSPERSRELEILRRRAYGPEADIVLDPAAQQRLRELEDLARRAMAAPDSTEERGRDQPGADDAAGVALGGAASAAPAPEGAARDMPAPGDARSRRDPAERSATDDPRADSPVKVRRSGWKRIPLWTVTAVAGIAIGLAVGLTWPTDSEPPPDLTLGIDPNGGDRGAGFAENLDYWGVDQGSVVPHESFDVIQVWTAFGVDGSRCLLLSHDGSFLSATCTGAGLDPVLDFTVFDGMSLDLDESLPVGTVIRFLGHEGSVDVWVRPPGGQSPSASSIADSRPSAA